MSRILENKLFRQITILNDYLNEIKTVDFITKSSKIGIDSYKKFAKYLLDNFNDIDESTQNTSLGLLSINFIPIVRYIERASTTNIPWSIIPYLDKILKNEFNENYHLIFRPQWHFNYTVLENDLISILKDRLKVIFPTPTKKNEINLLFKDDIKIYLFTFPYLEKTNVLLDSVIGHEIGHFFQNKWQKLSKTTELLDSQRVILSNYYRNRPSNDMFWPYEKTEEGMKILDGMYREIISDFFGYQIFGPSMIFALDYILDIDQSPQIPCKNNNYYPIIQYRIRMLYENLYSIDEGLKNLANGSSECSKYLKGFLEHIDKYLNISLDKQTLDQIPEEITIFETTIPDIVEYTQKSISKKYIHPELISDLFDLLDKNIAINEINNSPVGLPDILLAGWIYYWKINEESNKADYIDKYKILIRLLLKSTFTSYIHSEYLHAMETSNEHINQS